MRRLFPWLPASAFLLGCAAATEPGGQVRVEVLGVSFERGTEGHAASVPFVVANSGTASVYLARCGARLMAAVDRWEGGRWNQYSGDACPAIYPMDPLALAPGTRHQGVRAIGEPGVYRLRVGVAAPTGAAVEWLVASAPFEIR